MTILPSQVDEIDLRVEIAYGADIAAHPATWTWTDESDRRLAQTVAIQRGVADEAAQTQATTVPLVLDNTDGALTPDNPMSPHWPNVHRGTPVRLRVGTDEVEAMLLDGDVANYASTPDHASFAVTASVRLEFEGDIEWSTTAQSALIGQYKSPTNQRSLLLWLYQGRLVALWMDTGGTEADVAGNYVSGPLPWTGHVHRAVAMQLVLDDGAGNHTLTFETADTLDGPWSTLGDPLVIAGTTAVYDGTAPLEVGVVTGDPVSSPPAGLVHRARMIVDDVTVADPDFTAQTPGTTTFVDSAGRTWTLNGTAAVASSVAPHTVRFAGQLAELAPSWPYGDLSNADHPDQTPGVAHIDVTAAGALRRLGQGAKPLASPLRRRVLDPRLAGAVGAYWPLEDGRDATSAASPLAGVQPMVVGGEATFAADASLVSSLPTLSFSGGRPAGWHAAVPAPAASFTSWNVEMFVRIPTAPAGPAMFPLAVIDTTSSLGVEWIVSLNDSTVQLFIGDGLGGGAVVGSTSPTEFFDQWTLVRIAATQTGTDVFVEVLWVPLNRSGVAYGLSATQTGTIGRPTGIRNLFVAAPPDGFSIGHLIVQNGLNLGWLADVETAWIGEPAGDRIVRLCAEEGVTCAVTGDPGDTEPMGPQRSATLLELLAECAATDMGMLREERHRLGLHYRTRTSLYNQPAALDLDAGQSEIANPFLPVDDDQRIRNDIIVTRPDGSSHREIDQASIDRDGLYDVDVSVNVAADSQLVQQAGWRLHLGTWPGMRYESLALDLTVAPRLLSDWPTIEIGDRCQVRNLPPQHPGVVDLLVEGYTEQISPQRWTVEAACGPGAPWTVGVLDTDGTPDTTLAALDTAGSELAAAVDDTDLSFSVAVTDGPLWTTDPGDFPLDVIVGGEQVTVSAIAGASSPQTFTVSARAVNGVRKAHAAGTAMAVANPFRLCL